MTNEEILSKAIEKAKENGWSGGYDYRLTSEGEPARYEYIIFNKDFAKALWGEKPQPINLIGLVHDTTKMTFDEVVKESEKHTYYLPKWKVILQQMVIADDPVKYLGEHLD